MPFNLRRTKEKLRSHGRSGPSRPIDDLRELLPDIRYGDLDDDSDEGVQSVVDIVRGRESKVAVHGRGDNWTPVSPGERSYSAPTMNYAPEFGGRWRKNFPGSGGQHINDDSDTEKSPKGQATSDDFDPNIKHKRINDAIDGSTSYVVRIKLLPGESGAESAKKYFGESGEFDDDSVFSVVDSFERALEVERKYMARGLKVSVEPVQERD